MMPMHFLFPYWCAAQNVNTFVKKVVFFDFIDILIYLNNDLLPTTDVIGHKFGLKFLAGQYSLP